MFYDVHRACAETASRTEGTSKGSNNHVNLGCIDVLGFRNATAGSAKDPKGPSLIKDKSKFIPQSEFDLD
jgi:hypothetical protein